MFVNYNSLVNMGVSAHTPRRNRTCPIKVSPLNFYGWKRVVFSWLYLRSYDSTNGGGL